ncbi:hypothetical protein BY996DRAFT_3711787 [Phakopsora pachyrhizi]|nr:hypothetical protein BY996DRAFT_3118911 [Phakopsora pachyrhizi]KAI8451564.1 hypothetical protein BY996DRAFT_3711787 [Phakopsora pachyrhizi]
MISLTTLISTILLYSMVISITNSVVLDRGSYQSDNYHHHQSKRWLNSPFAPYYISGSSVYGGYYDPRYNFSPSYPIGSAKFYTQGLTNYLTWCPSGIYGFGASYEFSNQNYRTVPNPSSYSFFKKFSQSDKSSKRSYVSHEHSNDEEDYEIRKVSRNSHNFIKRGDQVQCRNQKGETISFVKSDCDAAAIKMVNQKSAVSNVGSCGLVLIGPQGQLSSSNLPIEKIQNDVQNILNTCTMGGPSNKLFYQFTQGCESKLRDSINKRRRKSRLLEK